LLKQLAGTAEFRIIGPARIFQNSIERTIENEESPV